MRRRRPRSSRRSRRRPRIRHSRCRPPATRGRWRRRSSGQAHGGGAFCCVTYLAHRGRGTLVTRSMDVCPRCGKPGHVETACMGASTAPPAAGSMAPAAYYSLPPLGASVPPGPLGASGAYSASGMYGAAQNPVSRALRTLKTQLNMAVAQREEDPERAWLELVSVRERLHDVAEGAKGDPLLLADVERFGNRLEEQIDKLTSDVGDEVVAPLYSWVDLLRQRARLGGAGGRACRRGRRARSSTGARSSSWSSCRRSAHSRSSSRCSRLRRRRRAGRWDSCRRSAGWPSRRSSRSVFLRDNARTPSGAPPWTRSGITCSSPSKPRRWTWRSGGCGPSPRPCARDVPSTCTRRKEGSSRSWRAGGRTWSP